MCTKKRKKVKRGVIQDKNKDKRNIMRNRELKVRVFQILTLFIWR